MISRAKKLTSYFIARLKSFLTSDYSTLSMLVCLALANNIMFLEGIYRDLYSDSVIYMSMARRFLEGQPEFLLHPMWPPLFPFTSAIFYLIFHDWLTAGRMVSVVFGSLLVIPFYLLTQNLYGKNLALMSTLLLIFLKPLTIASTAPLSEALVMFCLWTGFFFLWKSLSNKKILLAFLAGIFWGLTYLARPEGIVALMGFFLFTSIYLIWINFTQLTKILVNKDGISQRRLLSILLLLTLGFVIVYSPYYLGMRFKYNKSFSTAKASAIFNLEGGATKFNSDKTSTWAQDIWSLRTFNPKSEFLYYWGYEEPEARNRLYLDMLTRIKIFFQRFIFNYFGAFGITLALIGSVYCLIKKKMFFFFSVIIFITTLTGISFFAPSAQERYIYWTIPAFLIFIFGGIKIIALISKKYKLVFVPILFFLLIYLNRDSYIFLHFGPRDKTAVPADSIESLISADTWLSKNYPGSTVMAGHERAVFNSRGLLIYPPNTSDSELFLKYAKLKKVDFIIASRGEIPAVMEFLFKDPKNYPGLNLVYSDKNNPIYIYKVIY